MFSFILNLENVVETLGDRHFSVEISLSKYLLVLKFEPSEKHKTFEKIFLMVLTFT